MEIDILRGELERLFSLDEMTALARDVLGVNPDEVGGATAAASFAKALVERCKTDEALDALADVLVALRSEVDPKVREATVHGLAPSDELSTGEALGDFTIVKKLGEGPLAHVYQAKRGGADVVLRVLRSEVAFDLRRVRRYQVQARLVGAEGQAGAAPGGFAGVAGGRAYVGYAYFEATSLAAKAGRTGPMHLNEARPILRGVLEALAAVHERRLVHGDVKLENVLLARGEAGGPPKVYLIDAGADRLRRRARSTGDVLGMVVTPKIAAPELHRGKAADARSDVYAFGVLAYEVLTGKAPFIASTPVEVAALHIGREPEAPSTAAPRGWVTKELDAFVLSLLRKEPSERPRDAAVVLEAFDQLGRAATRASTKIEDEVLTARIDALVAAPGDEDAALALEAALDEGADATKVAEAFLVAVEGVTGDDEAAAVDTKKSLLFRAARAYEAHLKDDAKVEGVYLKVLALDAQDAVAGSALEAVRRRLGKFEDLVEMLLERAEKAEGGARARAMAEIGRLYAHDLDDKAQAVVAYAQALCEDPNNAQVSAEIERLAGTDQALWTEALTMVSETVQTSTVVEARSALLLRLGGWYAAKLSRPDLALPCYQAVVAAEPSNDVAMEGMATIYRAAQQWPELGAVLLRRADVATTPAKARDMRAKAAELLDTKLNEPLRAKDIYEQVLAEDPAHEAANEALASIYERTGDFSGLVRSLEKRSEALRGESKARVLGRIAELYEGPLGDLSEALRRFEAALGADEKSLDALKGIDRVLNRLGRYKELLANLDRQLSLAATPRQKIALFERRAAIFDEEFLDHESAASTYEEILRIDPSHDASLTALVRHYRALDRWEDVLSVYDRHLKFATEAGRRIDLLLSKGRVLADQIGSPDRATVAYEGVIELAPDHSGALEALARLREKSGDAMAALGAIEALAARATTPEAKAEQWMRAAKLLEARGDRDGAIERYKAALDADPKNVVATASLRSAYAARGDASSAVELIAREIEAAEGSLSKARLYGEMARLLRERVKDAGRAEQAAKKGIELDPTAMDSLLVLGDLAFDAGRYVEASRAYESLAARTEAMAKPDAVRTLVRYIDALTKVGSTEKAMASIEVLLRLAPDDADAFGRASRVAFEHGEAKAAFELCQRYMNRFGDALYGQERADALYRVGESARRSGVLDVALTALQEAADIDPNSSAPIDALSKVYGDRGEWEEVVRIKTRRLDVVSGDERSELLVDIGETLASKIGDRNRAAKSYVAALEDRPDDRRLLTKLMQLYSEEKDWAKLVDVVVRLADFIDDPKQKAKYVHMAASITYKQLQDLDAAIGYYDTVLSLDPTLSKALTEGVELRMQKGDFEGVERLLQLQLESTPPTDHARLVATFDQLGELYQRNLGQTGQAIDAFEAAQQLDPDNRARNERLADMYASDPAQYLDKAVASQRVVIHRNPHQPEPYKLLRRLYTEAKRADAAWCLCQALYVLNLAEPDEERFFKRMRSETPAPAQDRLGDDDWALRVRHADADPIVTAIFAHIEPAIIAARSQSLEAQGYDPRYAVDLSLHPSTLSQTLYYACGVLGMAPPVTFQNQNDPGGLSFLHATTPGIVMGRVALTADVEPQAAAFLAARHLAYYRRGYYVRHLVPTGTGLRAWLFAAIKLIASQFPVSADLEGPVKENVESLAKSLSGPDREILGSLVNKLLQGGGSLDLKKWVAAVDLTADRVGFVVAHDFEVAGELIQASDDAQATTPARERLRELVLFSVSEEYFQIRKKLGVSID